MSGNEVDKKSGPISRVLCLPKQWRSFICDTRHRAPVATYPEVRASRALLQSSVLPYLVLLRVGFTLPPTLIGAVRSYRTISPLPATLRAPAVYFLWHFPWTYVPQALPGTLLYGARTFLQTRTQTCSATAQPARGLVWRVPGRNANGESCAAYC